jgi:hypothetical protein
LDPQLGTPRDIDGNTTSYRPSMQRKCVGSLLPYVYESSVMPGFRYSDTVQTADKQCQDIVVVLQVCMCVCVCPAGFVVRWKVHLARHASVAARALAVTSGPLGTLRRCYRYRTALLGVYPERSDVHGRSRFRDCSSPLWLRAGAEKASPNIRHHTKRMPSVSLRSFWEKNLLGHECRAVRGHSQHHPLSDC